MSAVLLPSGYAETVGKPCATCGEQGELIGLEPYTCKCCAGMLRCVNNPCPDCIEGVVRERYVVAKARREITDGVPTMDGSEFWVERSTVVTDHVARLWPERVRVVPVEPLGETDWYIATEQQRISIDDAWSDWQAPWTEDGTIHTLGVVSHSERRFAITHVAHNVRELPVVDADEVEADGDILVIEDDASVWLWTGVDDPQEQNITDEPWASDLAPGDLVLELTEPPVLLDEPIVEMVHVWTRPNGGPTAEVVPLVLALGVNRIELP